MSDDKICANCGRHVSTEDRYCAGCGVTFAGAPVRMDRSRTIPGFEYFFVQGLGWGLGLAVAGIVFAVGASVLVGLIMQSVR